MKRALKIFGWTVGTLLLCLVGFSGYYYRSDIPLEQLEPAYRTPESVWVQTKDGRIHVRDRGQGPAIVLLHGSFSSLHTWSAWEDTLSRTYRTVSLDLPGHGLTGPIPSGNYSATHMAELVFKVADELGIIEFALAGNSMGGLIAADMALMDPNRIRALILIDAAGMQQAVGAGNQKMPLAFRIINSPLLSWAVRRVTPPFLFSASMKEVYGDASRINPAVTKRYYDLLLREGNREATMVRFSQREPIAGPLSTIKCPTLILWGAKDRWIPVRDGEKFHQAIPGSTYVVIPEAGHVPMEEWPEASVKIVKEFLNVNHFAS